MSRLHRREWLVVLIASLFVPMLACSREEAPEDPVWGKQACAHCAMLVSDKRYAAQLLTEEGTRLYFDDIGCMIAYADERNVDVRHQWVHDESADRWLVAERARYRRGARTPMDYGFAASDTGELTFDEVRREVLARTRKQP